MFQSILVRLTEISSKLQKVKTWQSSLIVRERQDLKIGFVFPSSIKKHKFGVLTIGIVGYCRFICSGYILMGCFCECGYNK
jgi:hypothetical protein